MPTASALFLQRQALRRLIRSKRQALSEQQQLQAATDVAKQFLQLSVVQQATSIALYLTNDAELDTRVLIQSLWQQQKQVYLPVMHPFCPGYLIFQSYEPNTPMRNNQFGIAEPKLDCSSLKPVAEFDIIATPLVAFDQHCQRLGMGGGFYDRTLSQLNPQAKKPLVLGLAHQCQLVSEIPLEPWDEPLSMVVTPEQVYTVIT